jgi:hypothetical protein
MFNGRKESGNGECSAVFTVNPFRGFTATGPSLASGGVTVFRRDFHGGFGASDFGRAARWEYVVGS